MNGRISMNGGCRARRSPAARPAASPRPAGPAARRARRGAAFHAGLLTAVLSGIAAGASPARAQGDGDFRMEVFGGMGATVFDEKPYSFDAGATAWLTDRWGLGVWGEWMRASGSENVAAIFTPAVRWRRPLRRGRSLHVGVGLGHLTDGIEIAYPSTYEVVPYVDVLYGLEAANPSFGLRAGVRMLGFWPHLVVTGSYAFD